MGARERESEKCSSRAHVFVLAKAIFISLGCSAIKNVTNNSTATHPTTEQYNDNRCGWIGIYCRLIFNRNDAHQLDIQ